MGSSYDKLKEEANKRPDEQDVIGACVYLAQQYAMDVDKRDTYEEQCVTMARKYGASKDWKSTAPEYEGYRMGYLMEKAPIVAGIGIVAEYMTDQETARAVYDHYLKDDDDASVYEVLRRTVDGDISKENADKIAEKDTAVFNYGG